MAELTNEKLAWIMDLDVDTVNRWFGCAHIYDENDVCINCGENN